MTGNAANPLRLTTLVEQPTFPACDLHQDNVDILAHYLLSKPGVESQAYFLRAHQQQIYYLASCAMQVIYPNRPTRYDEKEYHAFTHGFTAAEAIVFMLRPPKIYDTSLAATHVQQLLINPGEMADIELAEWDSNWADAYPNTHTAIMLSGYQHHESMDQIRTRLFAAHLALELQRPLVFGDQIDYSTLA